MAVPQQSLAPAAEGLTLAAYRVTSANTGTERLMKKSMAKVWDRQGYIVTPLYERAAEGQVSAATPAERDADDHSTWTFKQWYEHVGAWETPEGWIAFGSPMAVRAMLIQYGCALSASIQKQARVDAHLADKAGGDHG